MFYMLTIENMKITYNSWDCLHRISTLSYKVTCLVAKIP